MYSLLLDSANRDLNVGLAKDGHLVDRVSYDAWQRQSELMVKEIDAVLRRNKLSAKDINEVIVTIGPGSYTGIRIALTIAKTLAFTLNIPLFTISSLAAQRIVNVETVSVINARSGRSYAAIYAQNGETMVDECVMSNDDVIAYLKDHPAFVLCGEATYLGVAVHEFDILNGMMLERRKAKAVENVLTLKPVYLKDLL
ncbi:MAG: tRNA (adenosine(37)-N6)-threonylcarbamoyltransferase complex dimerization subunit type 1 TsaB [Bacteroidia bacterium]|nr:tRNA (adenosine(37)-N6)-threonylcarbamoyltransferase complex dimerization subunit type 1 TsaB [Bacteroidia bacterium]